MFTTVKPFGGLVKPRFACTIIGYVSALVVTFINAFAISGVKFRHRRSIIIAGVCFDIPALLYNGTQGSALLVNFAQALSVAVSLGAFLRIMVASSDSRIIPDYQGAVKVNTMLFLFPGIYCLLRTTTCILLIWGAKIERAQLVLPWIVTGIVDLVLCVVGMAVLGIAAVYFVICVMSYFEDLVKKPNTNFFKGQAWSAVMRERRHKEAAGGATVNTAFEA